MDKLKPDEYKALVKEIDDIEKRARVEQIAALEKAEEAKQDADPEAPKVNFNGTIFIFLVLMLLVLVFAALHIHGQTR